MYETLVNTPGWVLLLEVGVPTGVIIVVATIASLRRDRSDRSNDNVFTSAARFIGVSLAFLGAFLVADVWQEEAKWRSSASLEFEYAQSVVNHLSVLDPADARIVRASMHDYATDVLANERDRRPGASTDTVAARAMTTMDDIITGYQDRPNNKARSAALQRSFVNFQEQGAQRRATPEMVMSPFEVLALAGGGLVAALIMGLYPAGPSTAAKVLQATASWLVIIAIVGTPLALESNQVRPNLNARAQPITDFLDRLDHPPQ
jgi:hypothetical protein